MDLPTLLNPSGAARVGRGMNVSSPALRSIAAALALSAAAPVAAEAATSFHGVTANGTQAVTFTSDTIPAVSDARAIKGLVAGERLVALDRSPTAGEVLGLGSNGTLYLAELDRGEVIPMATTTLGAIPADEALTFSVSADGTKARVIGAGRDRDVALPSGQVVRDDAAVQYAAGDAGTGTAAPVVDLTAYGEYGGVEAVRSVRTLVDAAGAHTSDPLPRGLALHGPTRITTGPGGIQWATTRMMDGAGRPAGTTLLELQPGRARVLQHGGLGAELGAIAAVGEVADDKTAPKPTVSIPKQSYAQAVKRRGLIVDVRTDEPGQTVVSARKRGKVRGFGFDTAMKPGTLRVRVSTTPAHLKELRGKRVLLHVTVKDNAGNRRVLDRAFTLAG